MLALSSCKTKSGVDKPIDNNTALVSNAAFFKQINKDVNFSQLKINSKITAETGKFIPQLDATIYIEKDKKVWINMIAIFLNVGRGIATPDGIKGYEKWNKTYIESDFAYLNKLLNVNFIDYKAFQNLLIGQEFIAINDKDYGITQNAQGYQLKSLKNIKFQTGNTTTYYSVTLEYSVEMNLKKVSLQKIDSPEFLEVNYSDWESFENISLPRNVKIIIKDSKESQIFIENTRFDSSKMETPYSVPSNYKKTEIK